MRGGRSSTTCAPTAPPRSPELLLAFKAARRQEYLHQNLRILSAPRGETVETTYGLRWQAEDIRRRQPEPGEETLFVFTSQPYRRFTAARFGRVVSARHGESGLRLLVELGSRARATDPEAWERFVLGGPNPSEQSEIWIVRVEDESSAGRPPVEYTAAGQEERTWRETIARLAADDDYRGAVFLRVASVRPAEEGSRPALEPPYRFLSERPYLVRVAGYNPHLEPEALQRARVVAVYDELATAVVVDPPSGVPADGSIDVLVAPIVGGPGWLELNVSLGMDLLPAVSLGWVAETPAARLDALPRDLPAAITHAMTPGDPIAEAAVRAFAIVRAEGHLDVGARLRVLEHLRAIAPAEPRLVEEAGITLYEAGRYPEAEATLVSIPLDALGTEGRATLVSAGLQGGQLPESMERIRIADLSRPDGFERVLEASAALPPDEQVRLSTFVVQRLLSDDRAADWLAALVERPLPEASLREILGLLAALDPGRADEARGRLLAEGRLGP